jgi:hypothetical protein
MHCDDFLRLLNHDVESRQTPSTELSEHPLHCSNPSCREAWQDWLLLREALAAWKCRPAGRVDLADRVLEQLAGSLPAATGRVDQAHRQRPPRGTAIALSLAAAGVVIALTLFVVPASRPQWAQSPHGTPAIPEKLSNERERIREVGTMYAGLIEGASERMTGLLSSLLVPEEESQSSGSGLEWLKDWEEPLKPLQETLQELTAEISES